MKKILILALVIMVASCSKPDNQSIKKEKVKYDLEIQYTDSVSVISIN